MYLAPGQGYVCFEDFVDKAQDKETGAQLNLSFFLKIFQSCL